MTSLVMFLLLHKTGPVSVLQCWITACPDWLNVNLFWACELLSNPGCSTGQGLHQKPCSVGRMEQGSVKCGILQLAWSSKADLTGFALYYILSCYIEHSFHEMEKSQDYNTVSLYFSDT